MQLHTKGLFVHPKTKQLTKTALTALQLEYDSHKLETTESKVVVQSIRSWNFFLPNFLHYKHSLISKNTQVGSQAGYEREAGKMCQLSDLLQMVYPVMGCFLWACNPREWIFMTILMHIEKEISSLNLGTLSFHRRLLNEEGLSVLFLSLHPLHQKIKLSSLLNNLHIIHWYSTVTHSTIGPNVRKLTAN